MVQPQATKLWYLKKTTVVQKLKAFLYALNIVLSQWINFELITNFMLCNSYTMVCPHVWGNKSTSFSEWIISRTGG